MKKNSYRGLTMNELEIRKPLDMENVIEYDIAPMLKEYWFDDVQKYESQITLLRNILNDNR